MSTVAISFSGAGVSLAHGRYGTMKYGTMKSGSKPGHPDMVPALEKCICTRYQRRHILEVSGLKPHGSGQDGSCREPCLCVRSKRAIGSVLKCPTPDAGRIAHTTPRRQRVGTRRSQSETRGARGHTPFAIRNKGARSPAGSTRGARVGHWAPRTVRHAFLPVRPPEVTQMFFRSVRFSEF